MTLQTWILFVSTVFLITASPGPNALLALTHGAKHGAGRAAATVLGSLTGFMVLLALSLVGLGALLAASATAFQIVKWLGALYLIYLGIKTWRSNPEAVSANTGALSDTEIVRRSLFRKGFLVAISNPKILVFFAAFFPQFIIPSEPQLPQILVLASTFVLLELSWQLTYALGGGQLSRWLGRSEVARWFNRVTGGLFVGSGLLVAFSKK